VLPPGAGGPRPPGALPVTFDRVSFAYPAPGGSPPRVLHELSLHLEPGTVLGVLGRTGSGKSTLARLLLRFFDPQQGRVCLGGVDLRRASLEEVRRRVGLVTQEVQLFQATVRENLTFFDDTVPDERLRDVARELGLGTWLAGLPQGLDTPLAARGGGLSAGEGQLLALMRVFLKDAGLIVLDEASSRLDPATEALVEGAVDRLLGGGVVGGGAQPSATTRTAIVIAHRLATVQRADQVLVLEAGRVVEHGQRLALAADPTSHFARLMRAVEQGVRP
jgi:ATP-binding cassette subfamily B protein